MNARPRSAIAFLLVAPLPSPTVRLDRLSNREHVRRSLNEDSAHAGHRRFRRFQHLGFTPGDGARMPRDVRWPGVMARVLGPNFEVVEEGLCGRTTVFDDPEEDGRNGLAYFAPCLRSHAPLDLVIISLGCNDVKARFAATPETIAGEAERLIDVALASASGSHGKAPEIILVAPPPLETLTEYAEMFEGGAEKARRLPVVYRALAQRRGVGFVDAGQFIRCSPRDGIHYAPDQHKILGGAMAEAVRMMLA